MNKGALRGLGLPGSLIEQVPQLWVGGNPITSPTGAELDSGAGNFGALNLPIVYGLYSGRPASPGLVDYFDYTDDYRYIEQNGPASSGAIADNSATHRTFVIPTFNAAVTDYSMTGYAVSGLVGGNGVYGGSGSTGLAASGRFGAFGCHFDVSVPVYGLYAFQAHIGLSGASGVMATEMVAYDISALNSFGATATNAFGFRLPSGTGMAGSTNWGLMIGQPSNGSANAAVNQVRGPITLGGAADLTVPAAQVDIQNLVALTTAAPGTPIESLTDTPASGSALQRRTYRSRVTTTSVTTTTIWTSPATPSGGRWLYTGILMARQTGGTGGTTGQGCAWTLATSVTDGVADQTLSGTVGATLVGTKPTGWGPSWSVSTAGAVFQVGAAANENVTWWLEINVYGPLAT